MLGALVAFLLSFLVTKYWIGMVERAISRADSGLREVLRSVFLGKDMNKPGEIYVPRIGGIWSVVGIVFGYLVMEAYHVYINHAPYRLSDVLSVSMLLLLGGFLGLMDDYMGWKLGLPVSYRIAASYAIALPLSVVKAGQSSIVLPLLGKIDLGIYYSLILVPIGVMGASNAFNMLAGFNGLEGGMALIILLGYAAYALLHGKILALKLSIIASLAILAFLRYNWYPARTFPGNGFTYAIGALLAAIVIVDNFEKFGVALFTLYFLELALFLRGLKNGVYKQTFGVPQEDGTLEQRYDKIYSVTHLAIKILKRARGKATEKSVTLLILAWQALIVLATLLLTMPR